MNKLDYLAQKEEELRKLNEQLDSRKVNIMQNIEATADDHPEEKYDDGFEEAEEEEEKKDLFKNDAWQINQPPAQEQEDEDEEEI